MRFASGRKSVLLLLLWVVSDVSPVSSDGEASESLLSRRPNGTEVSLQGCGSRPCEKCVMDSSAVGSYVGAADGAPGDDVWYEMTGACTYARVGRSAARCASRGERMVFIGDSTMRQLFGAVACKLAGWKRNMPDRRRLKAPPKRRKKPPGLSLIHI